MSTRTTRARQSDEMGVATMSPPSNLGPLTRNLFWHGKEMGVEAFQREQDYHRQLLQTLTRLAVGCGVLCGLSVERHGSAGVIVSAGAAVDGHGHLVLVDREVTSENISQWICPDDDGKSPPGYYELCVMLHDCPVAPTPVLVTDCETRFECQPGAMMERFRFTARPADRHRCAPSCPGCDRHGCSCQEGCRSCEAECDHCVPVAWFDWDGQEITALSMQGRTEIASLAGLSGSHTPAEDYLAPRLADLWPQPGSSLSRDGTPSEWGRWRYRPRLELCFDQPIDIDRIDDAPDWIRAWVVSQAAFTGPAAPELVVERVDLRYLPEASVVSSTSQREVFVFDPTAATAALDQSSGFAVIVQARASEETGPANPVLMRPAQLQHAGTSLSVDELRGLWSDSQLPDGTTVDSLSAAILPSCIGDGYDGGNFSMVFRIEPVTEEPLVTAVAPHNGARVRTGAVPTIEISSIVDPRQLEPRAWLLPDSGGSPVELPLSSGVGLPMGEIANALGRFESSFDATVEAELARTSRFEVTPVDGASTGRVLVVARATDPQGVHLGAFRGTCLTDEEVAQVHADGPIAAHAERIRPSHERMPRAGHTGNWIHWTFVWEQNNVID